MIFITVLAYRLGYNPPRFPIQKGKSQIRTAEFCETLRVSLSACALDLVSGQFEDVLLTR